MISCIIQARMGSSRLPGKVMKVLDDENTLLHHVINQLKNCQLIDEFIVATTNLEEDDIIIKYLEKNSIKYFRGESKDVLDRYFQCAKKFGCKIIVRIPADKPLIDPKLVDKCIEIFNSKDYDYLTTFLPPTFPIGSEVEIFSFKTLETTWMNAHLPSEREHVTPFIYNHKEKFKIFNFSNKIDQSNFRWAVDRQEDFELVNSIISKIKKQPILIEDILDLMEKEPELKKINENVVHDEGTKKSLKEDEIFLKSKNRC